MKKRVTSNQQREMETIDAIKASQTPDARLGDANICGPVSSSEGSSRKEPHSQPSLQPLPPPSLLSGSLTTEAGLMAAEHCETGGGRRVASNQTRS